MFFYLSPHSCGTVRSNLAEATLAHRFICQQAIPGIYLLGLQPTGLSGPDNFSRIFHVEPSRIFEFQFVKFWSGWNKQLLTEWEKKTVSWSTLTFCALSSTKRVAYQEMLFLFNSEATFTDLCGCKLFSAYVYTIGILYVQKVVYR